jgi:hypothetical protein
VAVGIQDTEPGFIRPCRGARPATRAQRAVYAVLTPFYPVLKRLFPTAVTTTDAIAYAMLELLHAPETVPRSMDNTAINQVSRHGAARVTSAWTPFAVRATAADLSAGRSGDSARTDGPDRVRRVGAGR